MHIYITDSNGKTLCALSNDSSSLDSFIFYNSEFKQSLITPSTFTFSCLMNHPNSKHIACNNKVIFKYDDKYHMFTIIEIEETHNDTHDVTCYCESISLELINSVVIPSKNESQTAEQALRIVLSDVDWKVGEVGDLGSRDIDLNGYRTTLEEIQSLAELYEAEVRYRIEYDGNNGVKGKYIDFVEKVSDVEGIRFEYGVNTTDVTRKVDASNVCTAVIPVGNDDIDIGDIECAVDQYRPFVKPKGQIWVGLDEVERTSITSSPYHIFASIKYETDDKFELAERAWKHLQENKIPKVEYTFNPAVINQKYEIGAKAYCIDKMMNLSLEAEISEINICFEDPSQNSITLTNHVVKESNIDWSLINTIQSQLKEFEVEPEIIVSDKLPPVTEGKPIIWVDTSTAVEDETNDALVVLKPFDGEKWQEVLTKEVVNQQIVNNNEVITEEITNNVTNYVDTTTEKAIIKGNTAPTNPELNQLWIDTNKSPNQWKIWNGSEWQVILTEATDVDAQTKINTLQQTVNTNVQEIAQAKTDIQNTANELNTTKTNLLGEVNTLKANDTSINRQITDLETEVGTKLTQIEVETIVNNAVESLSGDGRNLILYGDCSVDIPRLEEENTYVNSGNVTLTIENGYLKFSTYSGATNCIYVLGENRINTLNAFKLDTYVLSFDFKLPDESDLTEALFGVVWDEYNGTKWHTLQKTINNLALIENKTDGWKRYALPFTFSQEDAILRHFYFVVKSASGLNTPIAFLDNIKVERGTEATAFSKNPNEMSLAEVNALKVRVTKNETDIKATNDKFASYVTQDTYTADKTTMTESIESNTSAIEQNAGQIALRVTNEQMTNAINDIQIGGRNILWNTNFDSELMQQKGVGWWVKYDNVEVLNKNFMDKNVIHCTNATDNDKDMLLQHIYSTNGITNRLENGEQYTLSFYIKGNGRVTTYIYPQIGDTSQNRITDGTVNGKITHDNSYTWGITDTWTRHTYTFIVNDTLGASRSFIGVLFRLREQSEVYIAMPQLEKGNKATDWSPAPEDTQVNIDAVDTKVETNSAELKVLSNEISSKVSNTVYETDQANLTTTLNSHQSQITQNANAITAKLDSSTYTTDKATMNAILESHSASIQANANAITAKVSSTELQTAIDNIKIGGRNLASKDKITCTNGTCQISDYTYTFTKDGQYDGLVIDSSIFEIGETHTISFKFKKVSGTLESIGGHVGGFTSGFSTELLDGIEPSGSYGNGFALNDDTNTHEIVLIGEYYGDRVGGNNSLYIQPQRLGNSTTSITVEIWDIQVEKGNKATDWSPAPEDLEVSVNNKLTTMQTAIDQKADSITLSATKTELQSNIDAIQVGGRNLLLDSGTPRTNSNYPIYRYDLADTIEADETVTLQIKGTLGEGKIKWGIFNSGGILGVTNLTPQEHLDDDGIYRHTFKWKTSYTVNGQTITVSNTQLCVYPLEQSVTAQSHIEWIKLERGNKATDWTPAPEDIQTNIDTVDAKVEANSAELRVLSDEISSKVSNTTYQTDKNATTAILESHQSQITQNANDITSKVSTTTYNSGISNLQGQIDANENDVSNLTNRVSTAESTLEQHSDLISTKVTRAEVEDYVNGAIESLSGDGRNMVVYGNCNTDLPRLEENNYYQVSSNLEASIIDNMLYFKPKAAGYCEYLLGDLTTLNGFENDTYTLAFNYNIPTGSTLTTENFAVLVHDGASEYGTFLKDMNVVSTTTSWTRVSFTFTFVESWKRSIRIMLNATDANSYIYLDDIKVEKGATPTAFTKNPNEMTSAELAALKQRITTAESTLEQHADKIESKVEQTTYETDMNGITTNLGTVTSTLTQHADMIETKVSKDGVISSINQSAESVTINANKINLQGAVTADSISSLNGLNVGNGQFVVDNSGKVTVGGTLNGASGTFTGKLTQDGTYADVTIENGTIQSYGTSTKINTLMNEYGVNVSDDTWESQVNNQGISWQHFSGATSDFESSLSLLTNGYMQLSGNGLDVTGNIHTSSITVNNNLLNLTNDGISVNGERVVPLNRINAQPLWSGALFMNASQSITPSKPLSSCANGWILVWSLYENSTTHDAFFNFMYVPKTGFLLNGESYAVSSYMTGNTYPVHKSLYTNGVLLTGTPNCSATQTNTYNFYDNTKLVLRYVLEY